MIAERKHSIRGKLTSIIMLTSMTAVLLACIGSVVDDVIDERHDINEDLIGLGEVIGTNSTAALTFGDHKAADEVLSVLRTKSSVIAGCLYTGRDVPFATYFQGKPAPLPRRPRAFDGIVRRDARGEVFRSITLDGERVGTLYIAADQREVYARMKQDAAFTAAIIFLCLIVACFLSSRLPPAISKPIAH